MPVQLDVDSGYPNWDWLCSKHLKIHEQIIAARQAPTGFGPRSAPPEEFWYMANDLDVPQINPGVKHSGGGASVGMAIRTQRHPRVPQAACRSIPSAAVVEQDWAAGPVPMTLPTGAQYPE
jgi:hypothetical protein